MSKPNQLKNRSGKHGAFNGSTMQIAQRIAEGRPRPERKQKWKRFGMEAAK